jgi:cobalamin biosynthesis protein CobD/CbiB
MPDANLYFKIFSGLALSLSCLLLAALCKARRNPEHPVIWAGPLLMIGLASAHVFDIAPGVGGFITVSFFGFFIFVFWTYAYLRVNFGYEDLVEHPLYAAALLCVFTMPWFFLYLAVGIYRGHRAGRPEHVKKVWGETFGR